MFFLSEHEVDLWCTRPEECQEIGRLEEYRRLMDEAETAQWLRYRVEKKRQEHVITRAFVRTVLSHYAPIRPEQWRFIRLGSGKPVIAWQMLRDRLVEPASATREEGMFCLPCCRACQPAGNPESTTDRTPDRMKKPDSGQFGFSTDLEFNLSHTEGMIVCAVTRGAAVGVDIEDTARPVEFLPLARRFFAPRETALLEALPAARLAEAFYRLWTLKEAYLKAQGTGLSVPLESFSFHWPRGMFPETDAACRESSTPATSRATENLAENAPRLVLLGPSGGQPADWQFREFQLEGRFQAALAIARPVHSPLRLALWKTIPLQSHERIAWLSVQ